jgi:hypothetical protein
MYFCVSSLQHLLISRLQKRQKTAGGQYQLLVDGGSASVLLRNQPSAMECRRGSRLRKTWFALAHICKWSSERRASVNVQTSDRLTRKYRSSSTCVKLWVKPTTCGFNLVCKVIRVSTPDYCHTKWPEGKSASRKLVETQKPARHFEF